VDNITWEARLRDLIDRCRDMADTATDSEAADALRSTALDLEAMRALIAGSAEARPQVDASHSMQSFVGD